MPATAIKQILRVSLCLLFSCKLCMKASIFAGFNSALRAIQLRTLLARDSSLPRLEHNSHSERKSDEFSSVQFNSVRFALMRNSNVALLVAVQGSALRAVHTKRASVQRVLHSTLAKSRTTLCGLRKAAHASAA